MKAWAGAPRLRRPASPRHTIASRRRLHGPRADDWRQSQVHDPAAVERRLPGLSWRKVRRYTMMTVRLLPHGKVHEKAQPCGSTRAGLSATNLLHFGPPYMRVASHAEG
jgi:hypothetical protein